jgi:hypothetical protein
LASTYKSITAVVNAPAKSAGSYSRSLAEQQGVRVLKSYHVVLILAAALSAGAEGLEALDGSNDHAKARLAVLATVAPK